MVGWFSDLWMSRSWSRTILASAESQFRAQNSISNGRTTISRTDNLDGFSLNRLDIFAVQYIQSLGTRGSVVDDSFTAAAAVAIAAAAATAHEPPIIVGFIYNVLTSNSDFERHHHMFIHRFEYSKTRFLTISPEILRTIVIISG